jgi:N-glycosidase YbiA
MDRPITQFSGPYRFLSNFWYAAVHRDGRTYPTAEHAYQAAKCAVPAQAIEIARVLTPSDAKRLGRVVKMRPDWDAVKLATMADILRLKFSWGPLAARLIETHPRYLSEGNRWGDTFWGINLDTGEGQNHLGLLLMDTRAHLITEGHRA